MFRFAFLTACFAFAVIAFPQEVTLKAVPPVVVKTVPEAGTDGIDPSTKEIRITFSKDMKDGTWSWSTMSKESSPDITGKPHYESDKRTCVLPVKLKSATTYAI